MEETCCCSIGFCQPKIQVHSLNFTKTTLYYNNTALTYMKFIWEDGFHLRRSSSIHLNSSSKSFTAPSTFRKTQFTPLQGWSTLAITQLPWLLCHISQSNSPGVKGFIQLFQMKNSYISKCSSYKRPWSKRRTYWKEGEKKKKRANNLILSSFSAVPQ